jgi:radical SAM-linked protein
MVFRDALPIGVESLCESVRVELDHRFPMEEIARRLDRELPEGLRVTGCRPAPPAAAGDRVSVYRVGVEAGAVDTEAIRRFQAAAGFPVERRGKKGKVRTVDLKPLVRSIRAIDERTLGIEIWEREGVRLRPMELLTCLGAMDPQDVRKAGVIRIGSIPVPRAGEDSSAGRGKAGARFDEESGST